MVEKNEIVDEIRREVNEEIAEREGREKEEHMFSDAADWLASHNQQQPVGAEQQGAELWELAVALAFPSFCIFGIFWLLRLGTAVCRLFSFLH